MVVSSLSFSRCFALQGSGSELRHGFTLKLKNAHYKLHEYLTHVLRPLKIDLEIDRISLKDIIVLEYWFQEHVSRHL